MEMTKEEVFACYFFLLEWIYGRPISEAHRRNIGSLVLRGHLDRDETVEELTQYVLNQFAEVYGIEPREHAMKAEEARQIWDDLLAQDDSSRRGEVIRAIAAAIEDQPVPGRSAWPRPNWRSRPAARPQPPAQTPVHAPAPTNHPAPGLHTQFDLSAEVNKLAALQQQERALRFHIQQVALQTAMDKAIHDSTMGVISRI